MSDTPRTDACIAEYREGCLDFAWTLTDLTRQLERELEELRRAFRQRTIDDYAIKARLERELAALRAERERLAQALRIIVGLEQCIDNTLGNVEIARRALGEEPVSRG